jgi:hypothetical protein
MVDKQFKRRAIMGTMSLFTWPIIRLFQLVFSAGTIFFSHNKSTNSVFQPAYQPRRTGPMFLVYFRLDYFSYSMIT